MQKITVVRAFVGTIQQVDLNSVTVHDDIWSNMVKFNAVSLCLEAQS